MRLVSNYPSFSELEELLTNYPNVKRLNVFLDLKNSMRALYIEDCAMSAMSATDNTNNPNLLIFASWLDFVDRMFRFSANNNIAVHTYTIADSGDYKYHKAIYKDYKSNRAVSKNRTSSFFASDDFHEWIMYNIESIMTASKQMFNTDGIYLKYCESDFVPYYIIQKYFDRDDCLNLICSADRDMLQTHIFKNVEQYVEFMDHRRFFMNKNNWFEYVHTDIKNPFPVEKYIYFKSILGDKGDSIPGVNKVGEVRSGYIMEAIEIPKSISDFEDQLTKLSEEEIKDNAHKFAKVAVEHMDIVHRNYRLMSFEELIKNLSVTVTDQLLHICEPDKDSKMSYKDTAEFISLMRQKIMQFTNSREEV